MNTLIKDEFVKIAREKIDAIDAGNSNIDAEQAFNIVKLITHEPVSKERAAIELGISPSGFDKYVQEGKLPKGKKEIGWKELRWRLDEIIDAGKKYKIGKFKQ